MGGRGAADHGEVFLPVVCLGGGGVVGAGAGPDRVDGTHTQLTNHEEEGQNKTQRGGGEIYCVRAPVTVCTSQQ